MGKCLSTRSKKRFSYFSLYMFAISGIKPGDIAFSALEVANLFCSSFLLDCWYCSCALWPTVASVVWYSNLLLLKITLLLDICDRRDSIDCGKFLVILLRDGWILHGYIDAYFLVWRRDGIAYYLNQM